jgi:dethiobiotin synthetase
VSALVVTGTDTDVGKTVVAAMLMLALNGTYWKPVQCGAEPATDRETVAALTGLGPDHFLPEAYCLREPLSPHRAAELEGVRIDAGALTLPAAKHQPLIVEGAGGVLVPMTHNLLQIDLFSRWQAPVVLCARTRLGTINHTLLTLEALLKRMIEVRGIVFVGDAMPDSERTITEFGGTRRLGRLPMLPEVNAQSLRDAFAAEFRREDFLRG